MNPEGWALQTHAGETTAVDNGEKESHLGRILTRSGILRSQLCSPHSSRRDFENDGPRGGMG